MSCVENWDDYCAGPGTPSECTGCAQHRADKAEAERDEFQALFEKAHVDRDNLEDDAERLAVALREAEKHTGCGDCKSEARAALAAHEARGAPGWCCIGHMDRKQHSADCPTPAPEPACGQWPCAGEPYCDPSAHPRYRVPEPARCTCTANWIDTGERRVAGPHAPDCPAR